MGPKKHTFLRVAALGFLWLVLFVVGVARKEDGKDVSGGEMKGGGIIPSARADDIPSPGSESSQGTNGTNVTSSTGAAGSASSGASGGG